MYAIFCDTPGIGITNYSISYPIIQIFSGHLSLKKYLTIATDISTDGFFKKILLKKFAILHLLES